MKRILTISFLFIYVLSYSQIPGYMGKRMIIGYSNYFMLAPVGPTYESDDVGFNTTHCFNAEFIIKNRTSLCLSFQTSRTGVDDSHTFESFETDQFGNSYYYTYSYTAREPMKLNSKNLSLGFKFFSSGCLAPVGKYKKVEALFLLNKLTYGKDAFTAYNSASDTSVPLRVGTGKYAFNTIAFAYTIGRQHVFANHFVLDYGTRIGFVPVGLGMFLDDENLFSGTDVESAFKRDTYLRMFRHQFINFHLGIGFLAF